MTASAPSPLAVAALALLRDGGTASDLEADVAEAGAHLADGTAHRLLDELCRLGVARAVQAPQGPVHYYRTPLGERLLASSFVGRSEHVDLLSELEQMRTDLLSTIAHELRTPLTAIRTSVGLLLDADVRPSEKERRRLLETIDRNATRMQRVAGDILDLARFRAGKVALQLRRFDAVDLATSAIASIRPLAAESRRAIKLAAPDSPAPVFGDYRRLEQALVNLLSNAQKYSPAGADIDVEVAHDRDAVSWTVVDQGPGIKAEDRARLFERFFVGRSDRSEAAAGIGLGLPITLAIAQAHGGRIDVDSEPGKGSRFRLTVPTIGPSRESDE